MYSYAAQKTSDDVIALNGFKQDGYQSILRFETWKEQKCYTHVTNERISLDEITDSGTSGSFHISSLQQLIEKAIGEGIEDILWSFDTDYEDDQESHELRLYVEKVKTIPRSEYEYMREYKQYVRSMHDHNNGVWKDYQMKQSKRESEIAEYLRLKNIYGNEVG